MEKLSLKTFRDVNEAKEKLGENCSIKIVSATLVEQVVDSRGFVDSTGKVMQIIHKRRDS